MRNIVFLSFLDFSVRRKGHANQTRNSFQEEPLCNGNQVKPSLGVTKTSAVMLWLTYTYFFFNVTNSSYRVSPQTFVG